MGQKRFGHPTWLIKMVGFLGYTRNQRKNVGPFVPNFDPRPVADMRNLTHRMARRHVIHGPGHESQWRISCSPSTGGQL